MVSEAVFGIRSWVVEVVVIGLLIEVSTMITQVNMAFYTQKRLFRRTVTHSWMRKKTKWEIY
jgi:ACR3 family arsenite efflux pump ArsB